MEQGVPVRVVRGHECAHSYVGKVYTYDGLYKVLMLLLVSEIMVSFRLLEELLFVA